MNISEFSIFFGGILSIAMTVFHARFYILFGWKSEFERILPKNKRILYTIHIALILFFANFSAISLIYYKELANPSGPVFGLVLSYALFWLWRTIWQIFYFKYPKGAKIPVLHYIVTLIFCFLFISYSLPLLLSV